MEKEIGENAEEIKRLTEELTALEEKASEVLSERNQAEVSVLLVPSGLHQAVKEIFHFRS